MTPALGGRQLARGAAITAAVPAATLGYADLRKTAAAKNAAKRARPAKSVLIKQRGLGVGGAKKAGGAGKSELVALKKKATPAKSAVARELAAAKKAAAPKKAALKKGVLKKVAPGGRPAALKKGAPAKSVLVRQKGLVGAQAKKSAKEAGVLKAAGKGTAGKELAALKKAASPAKSAVSKELAAAKKAAAPKKAALKKAALAGKSAALRKGAPAKSVLIRQKGLAAGKARGAKGALGKELGAARKSPAALKAAGLAKKAKAGPGAAKAARLGRLLRRFA
ncbi:MAG: histone [Acidimicrobiales bacterium]